MTVLIDSWAWIEYFKGSEAGKKIKRVIDDDEEAIISTINLAEVYRWILKFYDSKMADEKASIMKKRCFVISVDEGIAIEGAKLRHGLKLGLGDALVQATAKSENAKVLTGDPDFKELENVIYIGR